MGIIIDIIIVAIIALSTFLGYKIGLVKLGAGLFAGILAIVLTLVIYKPVAGLIIDKTQLDEKIENVIVENTQKAISNNTNSNNIITEHISNELLPSTSGKLSIKIVYIITSIVIFISSGLIIRIIVSFLDLVAKLPLLKQFNAIGGIAYGFVRGIIITGICIFLMGVFVNMNPESSLNKGMENSYITKTIYKKIIKF